jgi:natural product biosynthesis luciferase-like monooxygenase protein
MEQGTGAPSDRPRARFERQCSPAVTEAITQAADKMGVSFSTMVYAAWSLLLRRYTGSDDTIFGAVRAGRHIPLEDAQEAVGVYINTVPLRLNVQPDRTVRGWLNGVRDVWRSLRDHEHVPLAQIQRWSSVPANRQLFDSLVVFDRATIDAQVHAGRDGWEGRHFRLFQHTSYPLNLYAYGGETLTLQLEVDPGRFAHLPVDRFLPQLETILRELAADTERPVGSVPVLSPEEREELLVGWNDTDRGYSAKGVHEFFEQQVARTPTATALVYQDKTLTYDALDRRANQLAHHLRELGVTPGTLVGVCAERSLEMMVALLGILKAGGAYVPLDPSYPADRLAFMVRDAGLSTIITVGNEPQFINGAEVQVVDLRRDASALDKEPTRPLAERIDPGQLAYVIYTSGSTGRPKGVQVTHRNVANFFAGMDDRIGTRPEAQDVWLAVTSISFDISVLELFWTLGNGFKVVLQPDQNQQVAAAPSSASNGTTSLSASNGHEREREEANSSIDFSLFYFSSDEKLDAVNGAASDKYRLLLEGARFGDQNGFEAVWTPERHFHDFGGLYPNPSVISAAIAASTTRIGIRAGSCVAPLHHPVRIAEDWAVVDNLSGGRVGISFASGWQPDDFVIDPSAYDSRKTVMFERIEQVRALWRGDALSFDDAKGGQTAVRTLPRPVQSDLPIWVTAAGNPETFRMAGERGYNVLTHLLGQSAEELTEKIEVYRAARAKHGHDPSTGKVTIMLHAFVGDDDEDVRSIVREPMKAYLRSSIGLIKKAAWSFPTFKQKTTGQDGQFAPERLSEDDMEHVLDFSFERYYETSGLFGTPDRCLELVSDLRERGVDEIACLLDFGLDAQLVLDHLPNLADVRRRAQQTGESTPSGRPARFSDAPSTESAPSTAQPVRGDAA